MTTSEPAKTMARRFSQALIVLSGVVIIFFVVVRAGIDATPYTTVDSSGRAMGFNDPLSLEHYKIMIGNFRPSLLMRPEYLYEWILFLLYAIGVALVFSPKRFGSRETRWFFAAQSVIFPAAWFGLFWLPFFLKDVFTGRMDREGIIDVPILCVTAHTVWLITSIILFFAMRSESVQLLKNRTPVEQPIRG
jgi:hypothetical protein